MFVQIDQFCGSFSASNCGADYEIGSCYKRDHRAVVIGVRLAIKQHRPRNRFDSGNDLIDDFSTTPFAEIRDTLYNATHAQNPNRLVFGLQKDTDDWRIRGLGRGLVERRSATKPQRHEVTLRPYELL